MDFFVPPAPTVAVARLWLHLLLVVAVITLLVVLWWRWQLQPEPAARRVLRQGL